MTSYIINTTSCRQLVSGLNLTVEQGIKATVELYEALLLIIGFGVFAAGVAFLFTFVRKKVYRDKNMLDTAFDAGGKVSVGLTATTIVSQWTWAATLLYSCTVASKYGISGPFWYAAGATIQILLFAMLSVQLKIRAPGAKTFLQVIRARFGTTTHKVFVFYAMLTNIIVTANLMTGGAAVLSAMVKGLGVEYATMLMVAVIGTYTFIGGLGATFYVSYFNTALICIMMLVFLIRVFNSTGVDNPLGSAKIVYDFLACSQGPEGNAGRSFLTILSKPGLMFGLITISSGFGTSYVDQSYWQSSVAAKPRQGVLGFLAGGLVWFAIPFALASTMGLSYIALSAQQDTALLTEEDVNAGLVLPTVSHKLFGKSGELIMVVMVIMAITSTGSAEVLAVTSILVYDVYQLYLKPYRMVLDANSCILCGKGRGRKANAKDKCTCESMTVCNSCAADDRHRATVKRAIKPSYTCRTHGSFREYTDCLLHLKTWCLLWTTLGIIPLTILLNTLQINLTLVHLFMGVAINSAVIPITLSMFWERLTGPAMMAGSIGGSVLALISWIGVSAGYPGGLTAFRANAMREVPSLTGNLVSLLSGGIISILVSLLTGRTSPDSAEIWENTRDIDSPLSPWTELYAKDLDLSGAYRLGIRPSLAEVQKAFRSAKLVAWVGSTSVSVILVLIWPALMVAAYIMSFESFNHWVTVSKVWAFIASLFIIIAPLINEVWEIYNAYKKNLKVRHLSFKEDTDDADEHPNTSTSRDVIDRQLSKKVSTVDIQLAPKTINGKGNPVFSEDIGSRRAVIVEPEYSTSDSLRESKQTVTSSVFP